jgi:hypothetical protein
MESLNFMVTIELKEEADAPGLMYKVFKKLAWTGSPKWHSVQVKEETGRPR